MQSGIAKCYNKSLAWPQSQEGIVECFKNPEKNAVWSFKKEVGHPETGSSYCFFKKIIGVLDLGKVRIRNHQSHYSRRKAEYYSYSLYKHSVTNPSMKQTQHLFCRK